MDNTTVKQSNTLQILPIVYHYHLVDPLRLHRIHYTLQRLIRLRKERFGQADGRCAIGKERAGGLAPVVEDEERAADAVQMIGAAAPVCMRGCAAYVRSPSAWISRLRASARCAENGTS